MKKTMFRFAPRLSGAAALSLLLSCSADSGNSLDSAAGGSGQGPNGSGAGTGFGGGSLGDGFDLSDDPGSGRANECGGSTYRGEGRPLDIYIMMDRSGSMIEAGYWQPVGTALGDFVAAPTAAGIGVGIGFFPPVGSFGPLPGCDPVVDYGPMVPIGLLPGHAAAIQGAIVNAGPDPIGTTPTQPALEGARIYATDWAMQNPSHKVVMVLATDGEPNLCNSSVPGVAQVAATALAQSPSIETYVIGMGNVAGLNEIAAAGGTGQAFMIDPAQGSQAFLDTMNQIRGLAIPCDFGIPLSEDGTLDPTKINVDFTSPAGATRILNVPSAAECDAALGGWYYDDPSAPQRIFACPASCEAFKSNTSNQVDIVVGCATEVLIK